MSESNSMDIINIDLRKLNKSEIILYLLEILECMTILLESEDETLKTKEQILDFIMKAKRISDHLTKLVKFEKYETLRPTLITEVLDDLMTLTITVKNTPERKESSLERTTLLMRFIIRLSVELRAIDYEKR